MYAHACVRAYVLHSLHGPRVFLGGLRASGTSALCWACAGMLGERGLGWVVHLTSEDFAKINAP